MVGFEAVLSELLLSGNHAQVRNKVTWTSECTPHERDSQLWDHCAV